MPLVSLYSLIACAHIALTFSPAHSQLSTGKSEPCEVLDAYDTVQLSLSGNSSHLAPWHAKLGFTNSSFVSTLNSLTYDGGPVQMMDLIVTKVRIPLSSCTNRTLSADLCFLVVWS